MHADRAAMRTLVAFLLAPFLASVVSAGSSSLSETYSPPAVFVISCVIFYVLQALIGAPAYYFIGRRTKRHHIWVYALIGSATIALPFLLFGLFSGDNLSPGQILFRTGYLGLLGAATGSSFWLIRRPDRPNRL
jgi:hypothetical protein